MAHFISRRMNRVLPALALLHCLIWTWTCLAQTGPSTADVLRQAKEQAQRAADEYAKGDEYKGLLAGWRVAFLREQGVDPTSIPSAPAKSPEELNEEIAAAVSGAVEAKFPAADVRQVEQEANQKYPEIKIGEMFEFGRHKGKVKSLNADRIVIGLASIPLDDLPKEVRVRMDPDKCAKLKERYVADKIGKERAAYGEAQRDKIRAELQNAYGYVAYGDRVIPVATFVTDVVPGVVQEKSRALLNEYAITKLRELLLAKGYVVYRNAIITKDEYANLVGEQQNRLDNAVRAALGLAGERSEELEAYDKVIQGLRDALATGDLAQGQPQAADLLNRLLNVRLAREQEIQAQQAAAKDREDAAQQAAAKADLAARSREIDAQRAAAKEADGQNAGPSRASGSQSRKKGLVVGNEPCRSCGGTGKSRFKDVLDLTKYRTCGTCRGSGRAPVN